MWGWQRGRENKQLERIEALEKAQEAQDSRMRLLKNEWEDVLDRANRVMGRLNARIRKFEGQEKPPEDAEAPTEGQPPLGNHSLMQAMRRKRGVLSR